MLPVTVEGWRELETLRAARRMERTLKIEKSRAYIERWLKK
jgi:hypothetical protein